MHRWCLHGPINFYYSCWWSNLILCLYNVDTLNICMKEFGSEKNNFWPNDSSENLEIFLCRVDKRKTQPYQTTLLNADQLLLQLLMELFDTLQIQCRHIEHMHEGVWFTKNNFEKNDSCENLDNFSLIRLLYMHRWCLPGPINSYHSFSCSNLILCLYNIDILNICMKEFGWKKMTKYSCENLDNYSLIWLLYMHW